MRSLFPFLLFTLCLPQMALAQEDQPAASQPATPASQAAEPDDDALDSAPEQEATVEADPALGAPDLDARQRVHEAQKMLTEPGELMEEDVDARHELLRSGPFSIRLGAVVQVQGAFYVGDDAAMANQDPADTEGFRIRRARFSFAGDLLRDVEYMLGVDIKDTAVAALGGDQGNEILDAKIRWRRFRWAQLTVGLDKVPFSAFAMQSSSRLTLIERPLMTRVITPEYRVGMLVHGEWAGLGYAAGLYNGSEGVTSGNRMSGVAGLARLQYDVLRWMGGCGCKRPRLVLGGAYMYDQGPAVDFQRISGSLAARYRWIHLLGEMVWQSSKPSAEPAGDPDAGEVRQWGVTGDLGVFVFRRMVELAGRYEYFRANEDLATFGKQQLIYGGVNVYFHHHNFKLQINYVRRDELEGPEIENDMGLAQLQAMF